MLVVDGYLLKRLMKILKAEPHQFEVHVQASIQYVVMVPHGEPQIDARTIDWRNRVRLTVSAHARWQIVIRTDTVW